MLHTFIVPALCRVVQLFAFGAAFVLDDFALRGRTFRQCRAVAVLVAAALLDEPQLHCRAVKAVLVAELALHVALVAPVQELGMGTENLECRRRVVVFLDHIVKLGRAVLEPRRRMVGRDGCEPFIELAGGDALGARGDDIEREVKEFGNVLTGLGTREYKGCPRDEIERVFNLRGERIAGKGGLALYRVPFAHHDDEAFA